ncbi:MAG: PRC-barrel domain-containing protein [Trichloromonas sp.]|nr:PRC-barrel domain-containing protein [Trichloromonas sp.]
MLCKAQTLKRYALNSRDGEIGKVKEFYFDDQHWTIRYLVADTGTWLAGRQVLISPYAMRAVNAEKQHIEINLTKQQIEDSPPLESDKPVSRDSKTLTTGFMAGRCIGAAPMYGGLIRSLCKTRKSSNRRRRKRRPGIPICAAPKM